ncbi:MAG TPA: hypothetical protein VMF91_00450 [Bryobacteraceae bacterium]|nr:hypothetical protein [Bryobacteraceae bacterium]
MTLAEMLAVDERAARTNQAMGADIILIITIPHRALLIRAKVAYKNLAQEEDLVNTDKFGSTGYNGRESGKWAL